MSIQLKNRYQLGFSDGNNCIMAVTGDKCVYLNASAAILLRVMLASKNREESVENISRVFQTDRLLSEKAYERMLKRLDKYLEVNDSNEPFYHFMGKSELESITSCHDEHAHPLAKNPVPEKIKFYLTDYCPRRCVYCFAGARYSNEEQVDFGDFLSPERFREIISEAEQIGVKSIELCGGDPLILKNICDYVKIMVSEFSGEWSLSTKSYVSSEKAKQLKKAGLDEIQVSLDSFVPENADRMLGVKGAFEEIIETIKNFQNAGVEVSLKAVVTSVNINDIPDFFMKAAEIGVKTVRNSFYYSSGNRHSDMLYPSEEQTDWLNKKMEEVTQQLKQRGFDPRYEAGIIRKPVKDDERIFCGGFNTSMSVRYDGAVIFCDSLNHTDDFVAGNLKEIGIMELWNSDTVKNFSDPEYYRERFKGTECYRCNLYHNCFYKRCFVRSYVTYGTYYEKDPACPFGKKGYMM